MGPAASSAGASLVSPLYFLLGRRISDSPGWISPQQLSSSNILLDLGEAPDSGTDLSPSAFFFFLGLDGESSASTCSLRKGKALGLMVSIGVSLGSTKSELSALYFFSFFFFTAFSTGTGVLVFSSPC